MMKQSQVHLPSYSQKCSKRRGKKKINLAKFQRERKPRNQNESFLPVMGSGSQTLEALADNKHPSNK